MGYVYFIRAKRADVIKIGYSTDPVRRLRALRATNADTLTLLAVAPGEPDLERDYHRRFAAQRRNGEWFTPCRELLAEIELVRGQFTLLNTHTAYPVRSPDTEEDGLPVLLTTAQVAELFGRSERWVRKYRRVLGQRKVGNVPFYPRESVLAFGGGPAPEPTPIRREQTQSAAPSSSFAAWRQARKQGVGR